MDRTGPAGLIISLTSRCNLRCRMCGVWDNQEWDIPDRAVSEIAGLIPGLGQITWTGGEVFLSRHFRQLFESARRNPVLKQTVLTNGLMIDEYWAEQLTLSGATIAFSIDGVTEKTYESIRTGARFAGVLEAIDLVNRFRNRHPAETQLSFVLQESNYRELDRVLPFADEHGFSTVALLNMMHPCITCDPEIFPLSSPEAAAFINSLMPSLISRADRYGIKLTHFFTRFRDPESSARTSFADICRFPWETMYIDPSGLVRPHCLCKKHIGDIGRDSLAGLWNGGMMRTYRDNISKGDRSLCHELCIHGVRT
ncbi:MAG: radical SAM protein [Elusimicrobia bacterium]|nr:radical SAM protein [Elusimicrobiota bacterium]